MEEVIDSNIRKCSFLIEPVTKELEGPPMPIEEVGIE